LNKRSNSLIIVSHIQGDQVDSVNDPKAKDYQSRLGLGIF